MPFTEKIENGFGLTGIWQITETADELLVQLHLTEAETGEFRNISHERRRREYLITRLLVGRLLGKPFNLCYLEDGRPCLPGSGLHVSISHSSSYVVVLLSESQVGIDVEAIDRAIAPIARKFMSDKEMEDIAQFADASLGMVINWCAKEAVFKCTEKNGIDYRTQIQVSPFSPADGSAFTASLQSDCETETFRLRLRVIGNNILVWCVKINIK